MAGTGSQIHNASNLVYCHSILIKKYWDVNLKDEIVIFKFGDTDEAKEVNKKEFEVTELRKYILKNYNWSGIVWLMHLVSERDLKNFEYVRPTNLRGIPILDDLLIIPNKAIESIVRLQAKYIIESLCKEGKDPKNQINKIKKYVDGRPLETFAKDILKQKKHQKAKNKPYHSYLLDQTGYGEAGQCILDYTPLNYDQEGKYDFLRQSVLERNGLWSDEEQITNFVTLRRVLFDKNMPKYDDTFFVAWINNSIKYVSEYVGSTEPINRGKHGMLAPQTITMVLGIHAGGSIHTVGGRTQNAFRKLRGWKDIYRFQMGDTTMNIHFGHPEIKKLPWLVGKKAPSPFSNKNDILDNSNEYNSTELEAYLQIIRMLTILTKYGDGIKRSNLSAYKNLKNIYYLESSIKVDYNDVNHRFSKWKNNSILKKLIKIFKNRIKVSSDNIGIGKDNIIEIDNFGGLGTNKDVSGWSEGCQIILGAYNYYKFLNDLTQFIPEPSNFSRENQIRWYYTIIDVNTMSGLVLKDGSKEDKNTEVDESVKNNNESDVCEPNT